MLDSKTRWRYREYAPEAVRILAKELGISALTARLLAARGWEQPEEARTMLDINHLSVSDPFMLEGMSEAVQRIKQAVTDKEKILVYGDYDCDGVCSTGLLMLALREAGARADYYIPDRFAEGYGLNKHALERAQRDRVHLVITVDTGISAREEVAYGKSMGLDLIVTDHHEPPEQLPECTAVINPKKSTCTYPFKELAGVGVTLKVVQALLGDIPEEWLDIAAIGTIADLVPLIGENRWIAHKGLQVLNQTKHAGLRALLAVSGLEDVHIDEEHVGFALGPRLNAAGRLASADMAVRLLLTEDVQEARALAQEMDDLNRQRQALVQQASEEAMRWVEDRYQEVRPKALVVANEGWHEGVLGIVASRLVERYYVPTIVLSIDRESKEAKGSARSIEGFDIYRALSHCQQWLLHFGGHRMAAGMTLPEAHIAPLRSALAQLAEQWLTEADLKPLTRVDFSCTPAELTLEAVEELQTLAPYGVGHPKPVIALEKVSLVDVKQVGADDQHLKCRVESDGVALDGIGFGWGEAVRKISRRAKVDLIGEPTINEWNGTKKPQLLLKDLCIGEQQFFDWRGLKTSRKQWEAVHYEQALSLFIFRPYDSTGDISAHTKQVVQEIKAIHGETVQPMYVDSSGTCPMLADDSQTIKADTVILYDLPQTLYQFQRICRFLAHASRFYLIFEYHEQHFFSTFPTREHFRWYYAFLHQRSPFDLQRDGPRLVKRKGWTMDTLQFMTEVFLELEFVKIENAQVCLVKNPVKKALNQSKVYQQKQEAYHLEQALIYSTYEEVVRFIKKSFNSKELTEEARGHGL